MKQEPFDKRIVLQRMTQSGEWEDWLQLMARVNRTGGAERHDYGARRAAFSLTFEVRYLNALHAIYLNTQDFRIIYRGAVFYVKDYDDFKERHHTVKLEGVCNGEGYHQY